MRQTNGNDFIVDLFCLAGSKIIISSTGEVFHQQPSYYLVKKLILLIIWMKNIFYFIKILNAFYII